MTSPVMLIGMICGALDEEHKRNPGADLMRAKEIVLQCCERAAWEATRMDSPDMYQCTSSRTRCAMADLCALLDECIRRLDAHAAAHPEREGTVLEAEQIVCEAMRDHVDAAERQRLADTLIGRGIRGTP